MLFNIIHKHIDTDYLFYIEKKTNLYSRIYIIFSLNSLVNLYYI
jgi:hypothetical protein